MKYRELPTDKVNTFKAGDMIRVYDHRYSNSHFYMVSKVTVEGVYFYTNENLSTESGVYFQQCRKLEEIKAREFYIVTDIGDTTGTQIALNSLEDANQECYTNYVKVREILEE